MLIEESKTTLLTGTEFKIKQQKVCAILNVLEILLPSGE